MDASLYAKTEAGNQRRLRKLRDDELKQLRFSVFTRDGFTCQFCGRIGSPDPGWNGSCTVYILGVDSDLGVEPLHLDHVIPYSRGGSESEGNIRTLCQTCNCTRGDKD
jgi:5-methylcytosine-specific restriction endonuclease McrA